MDTLSAFIDDIYHYRARPRACPSTPSCRRAGPGQFEINLKHKADAVARRPRRAAAEARRQGRRPRPRPRRHLHGQAASRLGRARACTSTSACSTRPATTCSPASRSRRCSATRSAVCVDDHGRLHGGVGAVGQCLPPLRAEVATCRWRRTGASTIAPSPCAFRAHRARPRASSIASPAPTPIPIWCWPRSSPASATASTKKIDPGPDGGRQPPSNCEAPSLPTAWVNALDQFEQSRRRARGLRRWNSRMSTPS